jgi:hypothetical protein
MKFPITRQTLQSFDPVEEEKIRDNIYIQNCADSIVEGICSSIQFTMEWRWPKNSSFISLSLYDTYQAEHHKMMSEKRYIWKVKNSTVAEYTRKVNEDLLFELVIEKLKETFIGCNIIIDPLKTSVIIDWS